MSHKTTSSFPVTTFHTQLQNSRFPLASFLRISLLSENRWLRKMAYKRAKSLKLNNPVKALFPWVVYFSYTINVLKRKWLLGPEHRRVVRLSHLCVWFLSPFGIFNNRGHYFSLIRWYSPTYASGNRMYPSGGPLTFNCPPFETYTVT